ncbi:MAG: hypothetical protein KF858_02115 [Candidatus Sumerlaeia bacterium]|nr:hypothetical protein [Candidatus Sumerlaeia bacterium]
MTPPSAPTPKATPVGLVLAAVAAVFVLNFLILGYSTQMALKPAPTRVAPPAPIARATPAPVPPPALLARFIAVPPPADPHDAAWANAPELPVLLGPQEVSLPFGGGSVAEVSLRALHDGDTIAFRLEWADDSVNSARAVDAYRDGAALQFPLAGSPTPPSALMGERGKPVAIWHWRADWQDPAPTASAAEATWYPPNSELVARGFAQPPAPAVACVEYLSEGWGTLTRQPAHHVAARGNHRDGVWAVVFQRPLGRVMPHEPVFVAGESTHVNIAVWNGSEGDVNGLKSVSTSWTPLEIEKLPESDRLTARYVAGALPLDPTDPFWAAQPAQVVGLVPQRLVLPFGGGAVGRLHFRAAHDGRRIAFHLQWRDDTADMENGVDTYRDSVAMQFPSRGATTMPSPLMGERDKPVAIWQWRADWQAGAGDRLRRQPAPESLLVAATSFDTLPRGMFDRPVPETSAAKFVAAGWGTLTRQVRQDIAAHGVHADGHWHVVFVHDLATDDPTDPAFRPGETTAVNFAVWNGIAREVNGLKSIRMEWMPLHVEPAPK